MSGLMKPAVRFICERLSLAVVAIGTVFMALVFVVVEYHSSHLGQYSVVLVNNTDASHASGTATVEAAMMGTPFVMVYRVSPLTYLLGRSRVKVPHFAMVNLIAGKEIVPELVQHDFTAEKVVARLNEILQDGPVRERMIEGLAGVRTLLRGSNSEALHPVERAAEETLALLPKPLART